MHIKLGLVSSLVAAATASLHGVELSSSTLYVKPNLEETCFTVRPVHSCDKDHIATQIKHEKVDFHCLNSNLPLVKKMEQDILNGKSLYLEHKNKDMQAFVEVPVNCEKIDTAKKALRKKEIENDPEQRIHLIQPEDDVESICTGYNVFIDTDHHTLHKNENLADWVINEKLGKMDFTIREVLKMDVGTYENLMDTLKFVANQINNHKNFSPENQLYQQISHALPNIFSKIIKNFFDVYVQNNDLSEARTHEFYNEYKETAKRIYAYVVKQILRTKNNSLYYLPNVQFSTIIRKTLAKLNQELTDQEIQQVHKIKNLFKIKTADDSFLNIDLNYIDKDQLKIIEQYLTKIFLSGFVIAQNQFFNYDNFHYSKTQQNDFFNI